MRHQLLPEGDLFFGRIVSIPPFPHFIVQIFPSFYVLLLGRILSGVSTSCLYSVFEVINQTSKKNNNIVRIKNKTQYISELVCCGAQGSRIAQRNALIDSCTGRGQIRITYFQNQKVLLFLTSQVTTCNCLLAIFAGLLSDLLVRGFSLGPLAPFLAALVSSHHSWEKWFCLQEPDYSGFSSHFLEEFS